MCLARAVYSVNGTVLLAEGMKLTERYIERLKEMGISILYIADHHLGKIMVDEVIRIQIKNEATKAVKETLTDIYQSRAINSERIRQTVNSLIDELIANRNVIYNLVEIRSTDDYHFVHSVSVCVLSIMTGIAIGYNYYKLIQLGTSALLHDIGKTGIPKEILTKKEKLTPGEYEVVKKHTQIGYELLHKCNDFTSVSAHAVWQHHERMDGSGYPRGLKNGAIHEFARIIALADVYDALSSDRCYRKRLLPNETIQYIQENSKTLFDPYITTVFLQNIAPFPIGSTVDLNNGETGVVTNVTKNFPARPIVKVLYKEGVLLPKPIERDLKKDLTQAIVAISEKAI